jgi:thiamine pyrophosphate-dependent acetolactate synthase large subunit-like protein
MSWSPPNVPLSMPVAAWCRAKHLACLPRWRRYLNYPVTNTLMGLGAYPGSDRQFVGMLGMHGTYEANMAMHHSDLILAVGARFDDRITNNTRKFCPAPRSSTSTLIRPPSPRPSRLIFPSWAL